MSSSTKSKKLVSLIDPETAASGGVGGDSIQPQQQPQQRSRSSSVSSLQKSSSSTPVVHATDAIKAMEAITSMVEAENASSTSAVGSHCEDVDDEDESCSVGSSQAPDDADLNLLQLLDLDGMRELSEAFADAPSGRMGIDGFVAAVRGITRNVDPRSLRNIFRRIDRENTGEIEWIELAESFTASHTHTFDDGADVASRRLFRETVYMHESVPNKVCRHVARIGKMIAHPRLPVYYTASEDGTCRSWNARTLSYEDTIHNGQAAITDMVYCDHSDSLALCSVDRLVSIYESHGELRKVLKTSRSRIVDNIPGASEQTWFRQFRMPKFSEKATFFGHDATGLEDSSVMKILNAQNNTMLQRMWAKQRQLDPVDVILLNKSPHVTHSLGYWYDKITHGECLFLGMDNGQVHLYKIPDKQEDPLSGVVRNPTSVDPIFSIRPHEDTVTSLIVDTENETLYTGGKDSDIHVVHIERGKKLRTLYGNTGHSDEQFVRHSRGIFAMDWSSSLRVLATVGVERHVILWNPIVATPLGYLPGHNTRVVSVKFCPQQHQIFTYCADRTVRVWDTRTLRCMQTFRTKGNEQEISTGTLMYDRERDRLITTTKTIAVHARKAVIDVDPNYNGHTQPVLASYHVPDTNRFITVDSTIVRNWDATTSEAVSAWETDSRVVHCSLDFSGTRVLVTTTSSVFVYRASKGQLLNVFRDLPSVNGTVEGEAEGEGATNDILVSSVHIEQNGMMLWAMAMPRRMQFYKDDYVERHSEVARQNVTTELHMWISKYMDFPDRVTAMKTCGTYLVVGTNLGKVFGVNITNIANSLSKFIQFTPVASPQGWVSFLLGELHEDLRESVSTAHALHQKKKTTATDLADEALQTRVPTAGSSAATRVPRRASAALGDGIMTSLAAQRTEIEMFVPVPPKGSLVLTASGGGQIKFWDYSTMSELFGFRGTCDASIAIYCVDVDTAGHRMYTADEFGYIVTYDISEVPRLVGSSVGRAAPAPTLRMHSGHISRLHVVRVSELCVTSLRYVPHLSCLLASSMDAAVRLIVGTDSISSLGYMNEVGSHEPKPIDVPDSDAVLIARHLYRMQSVLTMVERRQRGLTAQEVVDAAEKIDVVFGDIPRAELSDFILTLLGEMSPAMATSEEECLLMFSTEDNTYNVRHADAIVEERSMKLVSRLRHQVSTSAYDGDAPNISTEVDLTPRAQASRRSPSKAFRDVTVFTVPDGIPDSAGTTTDYSSPMPSRPMTQEQQQRQDSAPHLSPIPRAGTASLNVSPAQSRRSSSVSDVSTMNENSVIEQEEKQSAINPPTSRKKPKQQKDKDLPVGDTYLTQMYDTMEGEDDDDDDTEEAAAEPVREEGLPDDQLAPLDAQQSDEREKIASREGRVRASLLCDPWIVMERLRRQVELAAAAAAWADIEREMVVGISLVPTIETEGVRRAVIEKAFDEGVEELVSKLKSDVARAEEDRERRRICRYVYASQLTKATQRPSVRRRSTERRHSAPSTPTSSTPMQRSLSDSQLLQQQPQNDMTISSGGGGGGIPAWESDALSCWNTEFNKLFATVCATPEQSCTRSRQIQRCVERFNVSAESLVGHIVNEWTYPVNDARRRARVLAHEPNVWYSVDGIVAKWVTNPAAIRVLGSHANARKIAANEVRAVNAVLAASAALPVKLCVPLCCVVTQFGMTFFCSAALPFTAEHKLRGEGFNAPASTKGLAEFELLWEAACVQLKIQGGSIDFEAHREPLSGDLYVSNVGRIFPPLVASTLGSCHREARVMRPELVQTGHAALSSEALRSQIAINTSSSISAVSTSALTSDSKHSTVCESDGEREASRTVQRLLQNIIPDRVRHHMQVHAPYEDMADGKLTRTYQSLGMNVHCQGLVAFSLYDRTKPDGLPTATSSDKARDGRNGVVLGRSKASRAILNSSALSASALDVMTSGGGGGDDGTSNPRAPFVILVEEMLARTARELAYERMQEAFLAGESTKHQLAVIIADLVQKSYNSDMFWSRVLLPRLWAKFPHPEHVPVITHDTVDAHRLFERICSITGAVCAPIDAHELHRNSQHSISNSPRSQKEHKLMHVSVRVKGLVVPDANDGFEQQRLKLFQSLETALKGPIGRHLDNIALSPHLIVDAIRLVRLYIRWPDRHVPAIRIQRTVVKAVARQMGVDSLEHVATKDDLAVLLSRTRKEREAIEALREAAESCFGVMGESVRTVRAQRRLADMLLTCEYATEAIDVMKRCVATLEELAHSSPAIVLSPEEVADAHEAIAACYMLHFDIDVDRSSLIASREHLEEAQARFAHRAPDGEDTTRVLCSLAEVHYKLGDETHALDIYETALELVRRRVGVNHPHVADVLDSIGEMHRSAKNFPAAILCFQRSRAIRAHTLGEGHYSTSRSWVHIGHVNVEQNLVKKAIEHYQTALHVMEASRGIDHPEAHAVLQRIADLRVAEGQLDTAQEELRKVLDSCERTMGSTHPSTISAMFRVGEVFKKQGKVNEALRIFDVCYMIRHDVMAGHPSVGEALQAMGSCYAALGAYDRAVACYVQGNTIFEEVVKSETIRSKERKAVTETLCQSLYEMGRVRFSEARVRLEQNEALRRKKEETSRHADQLTIQRNTRDIEVLLAHAKSHFEAAATAMLGIVHDAYHPTVMEYKSWMGQCMAELATIRDLKAVQQHEFERNRLLTQWIGLPDATRMAGTSSTTEGGGNPGGEPSNAVAGSRTEKRFEVWLPQVDDLSKLSQQKIPLLSSAPTARNGGTTTASSSSSLAVGRGGILSPNANSRSAMRKSMFMMGQH